MQREDRVAISLQGGAEMFIDPVTHSVSLTVGLQNAGSFPVTLTRGALVGKGVATVAVRSSGAKDWDTHVAVADGETFTQTHLGPSDFGGIQFTVRATCGQAAPPIPTLVVTARSKAGFEHRVRLGLTTALPSDGRYSAEHFWTQAFSDTCFSPES